MDIFLKFTAHFAPHLIFILITVVNTLTSVHALLYKRDARATVSWVGFIWLVPLGGAILYVLFGINRIRRRARLLRVTESQRTNAPGPHNCDDNSIGLGTLSLKKIADRITPYPLVSGNKIKFLENGDVAFPAMLEAIARAENSVTLASYIFDNDDIGQEFLTTLLAAHKRGVEVRILVDDVGVRYSFPTIYRELQRSGIPSARFLPTFFIPRFAYLNLRNHRKMLIVDGKVAFTGGMNIRVGNCLSRNPKKPIRDLMAQITGPVVAQVQGVFVDDWYFSTGEKLSGKTWFPELSQQGPSTARGIADGPDETVYLLRNILLAATSKARHHIQIVTPYFIPDEALITALGVAALRGVKVDIIIPEKSNLALVHWASMATLWQVLEPGCRVWLNPVPFDHTKLMVVDQEWTLFGSANWDTRSLRLNFEFNVESHDVNVAMEASKLIEKKCALSREYTLTELEKKNFFPRLRDGIARLLSPYL